MRWLASQSSGVLTFLFLECVVVLPTVSSVGAGAGGAGEGMSSAGAGTSSAISSLLSKI